MRVAARAPTRRSEGVRTARRFLTSREALMHRTTIAGLLLSCGAASFWACTDKSPPTEAAPQLDRKSTRLNSSHVRISYAVFCLKKKKKIDPDTCSCKQ